MKQWPGISFLDVLRPQPGERLRCAYLATYGLDLVALGAGVVAAAGLGDENGRGTRLDFATAIETVRDRLVVVAQKGRAAAPPEKLPVLAILDQFIVEEERDEHRDSWHPKIALVCHEDEEADQTRWRLWIGSRNLTRSRNWEVGLLLTSAAQGERIEGVGPLARALADRGHLPDLTPNDIAREVAARRWALPDGMHVDELRLYLPGDGDRWPSPPAHETTVAVSPFLDGRTLNRLRRWESERKVVVSTLPALLQMERQALSGFECYYLDGPDLTSDDAEAKSEESDEERPFIGLHAKILAAIDENGLLMWAGSANATQRAWGNRNAEVVAALRTDASWVEGLLSFVGRARSFRPSEHGPLDTDETAERLEAFRKSLCAKWDVRQSWDNGTSVLRRRQPFHSEDPDITVYVSPVGTVRPTLWPADLDEVSIAPIPAARVTELVRVRAELGAVCREWLMLAPLEVPVGVERDRRAIAELLDVRAFLAWIRGLLEAGVHIESDIGWDEPMPVRSATSNRSSGLTWSGPTLEDMLRAWASRPERLRLVEERVGFYAEHLRELSEQWSEDERRLFDEFLGVWKTVAEVLG